MNKKSITCIICVYICFMLIGCTNPERKRLNYIHDVQRELRATEYLNNIQTTSDMIIEKLGMPDKVMSYEAFVDFIKSNKKMPDDVKDLELKHLRRATIGAENKKIITDKDTLYVWIYLPDHKQVEQDIRFFLFPVKGSFYLRPYFIIANGNQIVQGSYSENIKAVSP